MLLSILETLTLELVPGMLPKARRWRTLAGGAIPAGVGAPADGGFGSLELTGVLGAIADEASRQLEGGEGRLKKESMSEV